MNEESATLINVGNIVRFYVNIVVRKWWVVVPVFVAALGTAVFFTPRTADVFETQARLLIVAPLSERLVGQQSEGHLNPVLATNLSDETLAALATANDLLLNIIETLALQDQGTGRLWGVESLAGRLSPRVENATIRGDDSLRILTMTFRGGDPALLKRIADSWEALFVERSGQLFATEAVRSYEFVAGRYAETRDALQTEQELRLAYEQENPLTLLQSQFRVLTNRYEDFFNQLQVKRAALVEAQAELEVVVKFLEVEEAIAAEPQLLILERAISDDAIFALLAANPSEEVVASLPQLTVQDQIVNDLYSSLKGRMIALRSSVAVLSAQATNLYERTEEFQISIEELSPRIAEITLNLSRYDQDIAVLARETESLVEILTETRITTEGPATGIRVWESAVQPRVPLLADRRQNIVLAGIVGLLLGVLAAFVIHYLWLPQANRSSEAPQKADTSKY